MSFETQIGLLWIAIGVLLAAVMYMASFVYALKEQIENDNIEVRSLRRRHDTLSESVIRDDNENAELFEHLQTRCDGFVEAANRLELRSIDVSKHAKEIEELHTKVLRNAKIFDSQYSEAFNRIATLEKVSANHKTSDESLCKWLNSTEADISAIRKSLADTDAMLVGTQDACGKQIGFFENRINDIADRQKADRETIEHVDGKVFQRVAAVENRFESIVKRMQAIEGIITSPIQCTLTIGKQCQ